LKEARKLLDAPDTDTLRGLRDRAILSVGFQAGPRRSEIASLRVRDFYVDTGFSALRFRRKGGNEGSLSIHQQTTQRITAYIAQAGHSDDLDGPLFRPVINNGKHLDEDKRRHIDPDFINKIVKKYYKKAGIDPRGNVNRVLWVMWDDGGRM
jgi:integrase